MKHHSNPTPNPKPTLCSTHLYAPRAARAAFASLLLLCVLIAAGARHAAAQASAIPSANVGAPSAAGDNAQQQRGRELLAQMIAALGGDAWLHRTGWKLVAKSGNFYKGNPNEQVTQFEEYHRVQPYASRIVVISRYGVFIPTDHRDVAELWTADAGYEITFKGRHPLPPKDVAEYLRRQAHSVEAIVALTGKAGVQVVYDGTGEVERHLADRLQVLDTNGETVTLELDAHSHLPLSRTYQYRDAQFGDFDTDREEYDNYQAFSGVQTPLTITRYRNGDIVSQRFIVSIQYNPVLDPSLFDPDRLLKRK